MIRRLSHVLCVAALAVTAVPAPAAPANVTYTQLALPESYDTSSLHVSADGKVAVLSLAVNGVYQVHAYDIARKKLELVSVSSKGAAGDGGSGIGLDMIAVSADGRFVAFSSVAKNLVPGDTNESADVFVRDRKLRRTERVSLSPTGAELKPFMAGFWVGTVTTMSADGRYVAFWSCANNLTTKPVPENYNACTAALRDRRLRRTTALALNQDGVPEATSGTPQVDPSGKWAAFTTYAKLTTTDSDGRADVYLSPTATLKPRLFSIDAGDADHQDVRLGRNAAVYGRQSTTESDAIVRDFAGKQLSSVVANSGFKVVRVTLNSLVMAPDGATFYWQAGYGNVDDTNAVTVYPLLRLYATTAKTGVSQEIRPATVRTCTTGCSVASYSVTTASDKKVFHLITNVPVVAGDADETNDAYRAQLR